MPSPRKAAALSSGLLVRQQPSAESYQAAAADDLAGAVEHVLNSRYSATRVTEEPTPRPRGIMQPVTSESLLAELAAARQSGGDRPRSRSADQEKPRQSGSFLGRTFAFGCVAVILLTLACMSPFREYVPSPLRDSVDSITQFAQARINAR